MTNITLRRPRDYIKTQSSSDKDREQAGRLATTVNLGNLAPAQNLRRPKDFEERNPGYTPVARVVGVPTYSYLGTSAY